MLSSSFVTSVTVTHHITSHFHLSQKLKKEQKEQKEKKLENNRI